MEFFKKKIVYIPIVIIILTAAFLIWKNGKNVYPPIAAEVKRTVIVREVSVSGMVKSEESVNLAFEKTGRVGEINVDVGDKVEAGDFLVSLSNGVERAALADAEGKLASAKAHYDDLEKGGRPEEIRVKETELAKAKEDLSTAWSAAPSIILDAYNKADNAVHRQADILYGNTLSASPKLTFAASNQQAVFDAENSRYGAEPTLTDLKTLAQNGAIKTDDLEKSLAQTKNDLLTVNDFLIKTSQALNASINIADATLATDKDALNTARINVNTAITNTTGQIQDIATKKIAVATAESNLALTKAGATAETLAGAAADVQSAEANVDNARAALAKTILYSPISGTVTKKDAKVGEIAGADNNVVSVMGSDFQVEAFIPEADIAKVKIGNPASITLDAYGPDAVFSAHVIKIDPAETVIDGVSTYKTTLAFDEKDERVKSGMTANTTVKSAVKENALAVPARAVWSKDGKKFVTVAAGKTSANREVTLGIRGSNGEVEILSGLTEGEKVITSTDGK